MVVLFCSTMEWHKMEVPGVDNHHVFSDNSCSIGTPVTVKNYLAAVRYPQIATGLPDPKICDMPQLEYVIKEIKWASSR